MSQAATSAGSIGLPRLGPSAKAGPATTNSANATAGIMPLDVDMLDLPRAVDRPAGDGVEVLIQNRRDRRNSLQLAALGNEFGARGLHVACLVPGTALQGRDTAVPVPGHAKAGEGLAQQRLLQRRLRPATPAIGRNHDPGDPTGAGVGDAGDFVETGPLQGQSRRGLRDERLDLL